MLQELTTFTMAAIIFCSIMYLWFNFQEARGKRANRKLRDNMKGHHFFHSGEKLKPEDFKGEYVIGAKMSDYIHKEVQNTNEQSMYGAAIFDPEEERMKVIMQNGNDGLHYTGMDTTDGTKIVTYEEKPNSNRKTPL